jgi:hypothetical protein
MQQAHRILQAFLSFPSFTKGEKKAKAIAASSTGLNPKSVVLSLFLLAHRVQV